MQPMHADNMPLWQDCWMEANPLRIFLSHFAVDFTHLTAFCYDYFQFTTKLFQLNINQINCLCKRFEVFKFIMTFTNILETLISHSCRLFVNFYNIFLLVNI